LRTVRHVKLGVAFKWGEPAAVRDEKVEARNRMVIASLTVRHESIGDRHEIFLEFTAKDLVYAERPEPALVERRVQPVRTDARRTIQSTDLGDGRAGQSRRRVHREVKG